MSVRGPAWFYVVEKKGLLQIERYCVCEETYFHGSSQSKVDHPHEQKVIQENITVRSQVFHRVVITPIAYTITGDS